MNRIDQVVLLALLGLISLIDRAQAEDFAVGEKLVVKTATKIMGGQESLGTAASGTEFSVEKVVDGGAWVMGSFTLNGRKVSGWVKSTDVARAKSRPAPAAAAPTRTAAPDPRSVQDMYNRNIQRYDKKYDFPATLYGFLPIRQGMNETITADFIARNRYSTEYIYATFPFDPSTIREAETARLIQSLPKTLDLASMLEQVSKKTAAATEADYPFQPTIPPAALTTFLQLFTDGLFTDAYAAAQSRHQQQVGQFGADDPQTMAGQSWVVYCRRLHSGLNVESDHHQALEWAIKKYGPGHPLAARTWNNLALVRHDRADMEAARSILLHALQLRTQDAAAMSADIPLMLLNLSRVLESEGRLADSLRCGQVARAAVRSLPTAIRELIAGSLFDEFASVRLAETGGGPFYMRSGLPQRPSVSNFAGLGGSHTRGDQSETVSSGFDSLNMAQIVGVGKQGAYPHTPYMLAAAHFLRQSDWAAAERFNRKAIELAKQRFASEPNMHWHISSQFQSLAMVQETTGNHDAAIETVREAIRYQRPLWDKEWKDAQAAFGSGRGQYFAFSAYSIYAPLLLQHAKMYRETNRLEEAERLYREALVVCEQPTSIDKGSLTTNTSYAPQCRAELAEVLLRLGKIDEAERLFRTVLTSDFQRWAFSFWIGVRIPALTGLAEIISRSGKPADVAAASAMIHDAYLMTTAGAGSRGGRGFLHVIDYARSLQRNGCYAEAALVLQRSIATVEAERRKVGGDELNRARYFSELTKNAEHSILAQMQVEVGEDFADHFGVGRFGAKAAFDSLEIGRGRALLDLMNRGGGDISSAALMHARNRNDEILIQRVLQLREQEQTAQKRVVQLIEQGAVKTDQANLAKLQPELQKARDAERQANRDLFDIAKEMLEKDAIEPMTSEQAAAALKPKEALLAYDIGPDKSLLLVVWPDGKVDSTFLKWPDNKPVGDETLSSAVAEFFLEVSREDPPEGSRTNPKAYAPHELRLALLPETLWGRLKTCGRLYIVADGPLHKIPFESLFLDEDGDKILVDEAPPIVYGPSATVLLHKRERANSLPQNRLELVALGDPQFTRSDATSKPVGTAGDAAPVAERTRSLNRFGTLSPLPGTRAEIDVIRQTLAASRKGADVLMKTLTGAEATVTNLVKETAQPRFLHLATHGLAEGGRKAFDSALALAAPAQLSPDDVGFLRLSDLMTQWGGKLNGTELVVLSACRTARGEMESGDGFVALTWGFLYAGSDAVIASLWEVDDTATALLMSRLYENLTGGFEQPRKLAGKTYSPGSPIPRSIALQEAKRWLRTLTRPQAEETVGRLLKSDARIPNGDHPYSDPYYWGAFMFFGGES